MYQNVQLITAHMPERFGTHHSKMMVLFRHDDLAQVIIHTANMIKQDWTNLTQGVWCSPLLPLSTNSHSTETTPAPIGSGIRFKRDLLHYLRAYSSRTRDLVSQLEKYDFGAIRAAFIASTPSRISLNAPKQETSWGWLGLQEILSSIPCSSNHNQKGEGNAVVVSQISSIATLGEKWVDNFKDVLSSCQPSQTSTKKKTQIKIIFPTAEEIRRSLDGYASGGSIHMKIQSTAQQKQLQLLRPMMCHWSSDTDSLAGHSLSRSAASTSTAAVPEVEIPRKAHRNRAAPHIKTYIRFRSNAMEAIDWAMLTSANLSQQAWGALTGKDNTVRICSYEVGVVVWPELFLSRPFDTDDLHEQMEEVRMVTIFGRDEPAVEADVEREKVIVGLRMPYDVPLVRYRQNEVPWCNTMTHREPDWMGRIWGGEDG
jgi:tyrosyl-DNA phosphodiesterase-1